MTARVKVDEIESMVWCVGVGVVCGCGVGVVCGCGVWVWCGVGVGISMSPYCMLDGVRQGRRDI